jgi:hypothetical protein
VAEYDFETIRKAVGTLYMLPCPACKAEPPKWGGGDVVASLPVVDIETHNGKQASQKRNPHLAVVPVTCDYCGRMELFSVDALVERAKTS